MKSFKELYEVIEEKSYPSMETYSSAIHYIIDTESDMEEISRIDDKILQSLAEDGKSIQQLTNLLEIGYKQHVTVLYCWRSISKAIPKDDNFDKTKSQEFQKRYLEVAKQVLDILNNLFSFFKEFCDLFIDVLKKAVCKEGKSGYVSLKLNMVLIDSLDLLLVLDCLKLYKASFLNDLSIFKRISSNSNTGTKLFADITIVHSFANFFHFISTLKNQIGAIEGGQEYMISLLKFSQARIEKELYITPQERHKIFRTMCCLLFLMEQSKSVSKLSQKNVISIQKIDEILRDCPVVPVMGDLTFECAAFLKRIPSISDYGWTFLNEEHINAKLNITTLVTEINKDFFEYITEFSLCNSQFSKYTNLIIDVPFAKHVFYVTKKGLALLSRITSKLLEIYAYKLKNLPEKISYENEEDTSMTNHEKAIKYCFSSSEKIAFIQLIFSIRTIYGVLCKATNYISICVQTWIHSEIELLMNDALLPLSKKMLNSSKKSDLKSIVELLINVCLDNSANEELHKNCSQQKKNTAGSEKFSTSKSQGGISLTATQIYIARNLLSEMLKQPSHKKKISDLEFAAIHEFLINSNFYQPLLIFPKTLLQVSDLSMFWFREISLEMYNATSRTFSVTNSFLFNLVGEASNHPENISSNRIFYLLDLYNDAANFALHELNCKFLCDEIVAEADICYRQLCYFLCERIYNYYKGIASSLVLNKCYKGKLKELIHTKKISEVDYFMILQPSRQFSAVLHQRAVTLLGRSINFRQILSERIEKFFIDSLELAFTSFQSIGLSNIMELQTLIKINKVAHLCLSEFIHLQPFDILYQLVNQPLPGTDFPRIVGILIEMLLGDLFDNYSYCSSTQQFVKSFSGKKDGNEFQFTNSLADDDGTIQGENEETKNSSGSKRKTILKIPLLHSYGTKNLQSMFFAYHKMFDGFIGPPHLEALCSVLKFTELSYLSSVLGSFLVKMASTQLAETVNALLEYIPTNVTLPHDAYGVNGALIYIKNKHLKLFNYIKENSMVIKGFKIFGNCLIFIFNLESTLKSLECVDLLLGAPLCGVTPSPDVHGASNMDGTFSRLASFDVLNFEKKIKTLNLEQNNSLLMTQLMSINSDRFVCGLSIFAATIEKIAENLDSTVWKGIQTSGDNTKSNKGNGFYKVWSLILYSMATCDTEEVMTCKFGDGLVWSGALLIILLQQTNRFHLADFVRYVVEMSKSDTVPGTSTRKTSSSSPGQFLTVKKSTPKESRSFSTFRKDVDVEKYENERQITHLVKVHEITLLAMALFRGAMQRNTQRKPYIPFNAPTFDSKTQLFSR